MSKTSKIQPRRPDLNSRPVQQSNENFHQFNQNTTQKKKDLNSNNIIELTHYYMLKFSKPKKTQVPNQNLQIILIIRGIKNAEPEKVLNKKIHFIITI
jgi:hypothetical protein